MVSKSPTFACAFTFNRIKSSNINDNYIKGTLSMVTKKKKKSCVVYKLFREVGSKKKVPCFSHLVFISLMLPILIFYIWKVEFRVKKQKMNRILIFLETFIWTPLSNIFLWLRMNDHIINKTIMGNNTMENILFCCML